MNFFPLCRAIIWTVSDSGCIEWHGRYELDTTALIDSITVKTTKREKARAKMIQLLEHGDKPAKEVYAGLSNIGIGSRTVEKVKKELQIKTYRSGGCWYWQLPQKLDEA